MIQPPIHPKEAERLASLYAHRVMDTDPEQAFDDLTELATRICNVPIALVSLIDDERQWFKSKVGLDACETSRDLSFCGHAICEMKTLVIEDATKDERFYDNPFVTDGLKIRFYAGAKVCDDQGLPLGTLCIIDDKPRQFDAKQQKQLEQLAYQVSRQFTLHKLLKEMSEAAHSDGLTGLLNRRGLIGVLQAIRPDADQRHAVIYIDLDRFKPINDSFGHDVGDQVLKAIATRIQHTVRHEAESDETDVYAVARIGGDEFVVSICTRRDPQWIEATLLPALNETVEQPVHWNHKQLVVAASMGLTVSEPGQMLPTEEALRDADIAMYQAKRGGKRSMRFDTTMHQRLCREIDIEERLRKAVERDEITAVFEPIIDLNDGKVLGFETLARWTCPVLGKVPPYLFIPIAERTGLIDQVFDAVARQALQTYQSVAPVAQHPVWFSVNLSKAQLNDDRLFGHLERLTTQIGVDPQHLQLEVTESLVASAEGMVAKLHRLREMGHRLMLDDFGSGTSALSCLKDFPVQWIKIDRGLTEAAASGRAYSAILHAVAELSQNLGLNLVAEGVEDADYIPLLQGMEVNAAQGWYWSKPIAYGDVASWLTCYDRRSKKAAQVA